LAISIELYQSFQAAKNSCPPVAGALVHTARCSEAFQCATVVSPPRWFCSDSVPHDGDHRRESGVAGLELVEIVCRRTELPW
jgi:hypothetical protein